MSTPASPAMNSVNRSWYRLLMSRFFQLRLYVRDGDAAGGWVGGFARSLISGDLCLDRRDDLLHHHVLDDRADAVSFVTVRRPALHGGAALQEAEHRLVRVGRDQHADLARNHVAGHLYLHH